MDIKQLYYFTAVAQAGSYSKAAESLAVSQPTLSVTVKKLEEELGVQLFYAFNREQHLTDEGLRLWTKAKQILDLYQETLDDMKTTNKNSSGKFTLGLSPLFGACFFGDLIPNFSMEYPNIEIKMINVCCVPMSDSMKYWDIVLAWNKDKYMPKACALFLDYCKHHLPPDDL